MRETEKIWMNGEFIDWADAKVHVGVTRPALRHGRLRGHPLLRDAAGPGRLPAREHLRAARTTRRGSSTWSCRTRSTSCATATHELIGAQRPAGVLRAAVRVLRLRRARRAHEGEPGRRRDHELAVGRPTSATRDCAPASARRSRPGSGSARTRSRTSPRRPGSTSTRCSRCTEAQRAGYDEAILLTDDGFVADGSGENVFVVKDGRIWTPPLSTSILPGHHARQRHPDRAGPRLRRRGGEPVRSDLYLADEVFMTRNRSRGDAGALRRRQRVGVGPVTLELQNAYLDTVRGKSERWGHWLDRVRFRAPLPPRRDEPTRAASRSRRRTSTSGTRSSCWRCCGRGGSRSGRRSTGSRSSSPRRSARRTRPRSPRAPPASICWPARGRGRGRRGDHVSVLVRRLRELLHLRGSDPRLRGRRRADDEPRPGRRRGRDHGADEGDRRGRHLRLPVRARSAARAVRAARPDR